jgi:transposase
MTPPGLHPETKEVLMTVYLGIDWSQDKHDAVYLNAAGARLADLTFPHSPEGFSRLEEIRQRLGVEPCQCLVALETSHNLLVDFLWDRGYDQVYVLPPKMVQRSRERYRLSGARSDPSDAYVIADVLRTDRGRLQPWFPDTVLTRRIRSKVSLIDHLTAGIVRLSNRLRAVLLRYYPAAVDVFSELTTPLTLVFIQAYPTPEAAASLTFGEFQAFARQHRYPNPRALVKPFARLQAPHAQANPDTVLVYQAEAPLLAELVLSMVRAKKEALRELRDLFQQHPDAAVFSSLPGAGDFLAPALLAKFGDDRKRFPSAASIQALAGTCPVTKSSGKWKRVSFRFACDHEFRRTAIQWARCSLRQSVWATAYYDRVRPHCRSQSHAYRCLANRWLAIAWKLWQAGQVYDETYHLRQRALRSSPRT